MSALWLAWALSTLLAAQFAYLWLRTLNALTDAEIERDEAIDRLLEREIFAAPTSFRRLDVTKPPPTMER